jgi:hypothetical protein
LLPNQVSILIGNILATQDIIEFHQNRCRGLRGLDRGRRRNIGCCGWSWCGRVGW